MNMWRYIPHRIPGKSICFGPVGRKETTMELNETLKDSVKAIAQTYHRYGRYAALIKIRETQDTVITPNIDGFIESPVARTFIRDLSRLEDALDQGSVEPEKFVELSIGFARLVNGRNLHQ
jgi:hypothetical protein